MARSHATVFTSIWKDPDFTALAPGPQRMYLLILSQPDLNSCGVIAYRPKVWATYTPGNSAASVAKDVAALAKSKFLLVDHATDECCVRSFMRHDGVLKAPNIFKSACRAYGAIHSATIRASIEAALPAQVKPGFPDAYLNMNPKKIGELLRATPPEPSREPFPEPSPEPMPEGSPRASFHPPPATLLPQPSGEPSGPPSTETPAGTTHQRPNPGPATDPEEDPPRTITNVVDAAIAHMALCDEALHRANGSTIRNRTAWLKAAETNRRNEHHAELHRRATSNPNIDPVALAEQLDPTCGPLDGGTARSAQAWTQTQTEHDTERTAQADERRHRQAIDAHIAQLDPTTRADLEQRAAATIANPKLRTQPALVHAAMRTLTAQEHPDL